MHDYAAIREWRAENGVAGKPASIAQIAAQFDIGTSTVKRAMQDGIGPFPGDRVEAAGIGPFPEGKAKA